MARSIMDRVKGTDRLMSRSERRGVQANRTQQASGRRPNSPRGGGRAWINGREVGGAQTRFSYLDATYD